MIQAHAPWSSTDGSEVAERADREEAAAAGDQHPGKDGDREAQES
jgi:hypothetical protein